MSATMTAAPARTKSTAVAAPMPAPPAVTTATLPANRPRPESLMARHYARNRARCKPVQEAEDHDRLLELSAISCRSCPPARGEMPDLAELAPRRQPTSTPVNQRLDSSPRWRGACQRTIATAAGGGSDDSLPHDARGRDWRRSHRLWHAEWCRVRPDSLRASARGRLEAIRRGADAPEPGTDEVRARDQWTASRVRGAVATVGSGHRR